MGKFRTLGHDPANVYEKVDNMVSPEIKLRLNDVLIFCFHWDISPFTHYWTVIPFLAFRFSCLKVAIRNVYENAI